MYNEEGKKQQAERLFRTAINVDRNFKQARDALRSLHTQPGNLIDWVEWWFGSTVSKSKKLIGSGLILTLAILIGKACHVAFIGKDIPNSMFVIIGISIVLLLLPCISKLKFGPIELEMESKGECPVLR